MNLDPTLTRKEQHPLENQGRADHIRTPYLIMRLTILCLFLIFPLPIGNIRRNKRTIIYSIYPAVLHSASRAGIMSSRLFLLLTFGYLVCMYGVGVV